MNTRIFLIIISLLFFSENIPAQGLFKKFLKKDKSEAVLDTLAMELPTGVTYYPCTIVEEKYVVTNSITFPEVSSEQIFINLLLYSIEQKDAGKEHFMNLDMNQKTVSLLTEVKSKVYTENQTFYKCANTFKVTNNELSFLSSDMYICSNNLFGEPKETPFENLQPNQKAKHKNYINEFTAENSILLNNLFQYIRNNQPEPIKHWKEIANKQIIIGMNSTECLLAVGKPMHIRQNGNQTKWMVNNDFVVIFENGIVTKVIN